MRTELRIVVGTFPLPRLRARPVADSDITIAISNAKAMAAQPHTCDGHNFDFNLGYGICHGGTVHRNYGYLAEAEQVVVLYDATRNIVVCYPRRVNARHSTHDASILARQRSGLQGLTHLNSQRLTTDEFYRVTQSIVLARDLITEALDQWLQSIRSNDRELPEDLQPAGPPIDGKYRRVITLR